MNTTNRTVSPACNKCQDSWNSCAELYPSSPQYCGTKTEYLNGNYPLTSLCCCSLDQECYMKSGMCLCTAAKKPLAAVALPSMRCITECSGMSGSTPTTAAPFQDNKPHSTSMSTVLITAGVCLAIPLILIACYVSKELLDTFQLGPPAYDQEDFIVRVEPIYDVQHKDEITSPTLDRSLSEFGDARNSTESSYYREDHFHPFVSELELSCCIFVILHAQKAQKRFRYHEECPEQWLVCVGKRNERADLWVEISTTSNVVYAS
ncbi:hypothetical protein LEN26_012153 [Aphanomyces euteiches]|nr:hypothetical protein LEN26_012153 [Aphanomyces euteiches]